MPPLSSSSKSLLILLVLLAASEFVVRGPVRFLRAADFNDFISPYIQSRALVLGMDPYSPEVLVRLWPVDSDRRPDAKDLADGSLTVKRGIPTAYPLTCLFLLAPLAVLPWPVAYLAWLVITVCLIFGLIGSLLAMGGFGRNDWRAYVFVAFSLALAPLHTGLGAGSIVIATVALCGIALALDERGREIIAGVLFGIAVGLKPQIGLPFLAYYLLRRHWRLFGIAAGVVVTTALLAIARLAISGTPWLQNYRLDNKVLLATGILSDFTERNPIRFSLINLQVLFYAILHHAVVANVLALAVSATLFGIWVWLVLRNRSLVALLPMGTLAVLSLLPVYHRLYDAFLLVFPLCWSLKEFSGSKAARGTFLLMLPFLVPGGSALEQLQLRGRIPDGIAHSWYWTRFVMPHQIWFLLLLSLLLLWRMASERVSDLP
jgi:MFS family permease